MLKHTQAIRHMYGKSQFGTIMPYLYNIMISANIDYIAHYCRHIQCIWCNVPIRQHIPFGVYFCTVVMINCQ